MIYVYFCTITRAYMSNSWFQFKRFIVQQDHCAMKVGTDGVLLGAWASLDGGLPILDIGTGTGVVALIAAQRLETCCQGSSTASNVKPVTAVELDCEAAAQASGNFSASPWAEKIECVCCDVKDFRPENLFGTILCNPPFFRNSLRCPDEARNNARHGDNLSFEELAACVNRLLKPDGLFSVVIPADGMAAFIRAFAMNALYPIRRTDVCTKAGKTPKRSLLIFSSKPAVCDCTVISILDADGNPSSDYIELVRDFYL